MSQPEPEQELSSLQRLLQRIGPVGQAREEARPKLPTSVVTHDSWDDYMLATCKEQSPKYRHAVIDDPPRVEPHVKEPEPISDESTPEELAAWQQATREVKAARAKAEPYKAWESLTDDLWRACHHQRQPLTLDQVHPGAELHKQIMDVVLDSEEFAKARPHTRDDKAMSSIWVMSFVEELTALIEDKLREKIREREEREQAEQEEQEAQEGIEGLLPPDFPQPAPGGTQPGGAPGEEGEPEGEGGEGGTPTPTEITLTPEQEKDLEQLLEQREEARATADGIKGPGEALTPEVIEAIEDAAATADERTKECAMPSFGYGLGESEPTYESPEQAIKVAEAWGRNPELRAMVDLAGREKAVTMALRAKRVEDGNDEIVDIETGDDLALATPDELALLADGATQDLFFAHLRAGEMMQFTTEGEEDQGLGPIGMVIDGSGSMKRSGRNIRARASALAWLHVARQGHRDFFVVEFASAGATEEWVFPARQPLDGEKVLALCSHFFNGGTVPIGGIKRAATIMDEVPAFKKADLVIVGDGDAPFTDADEKLRDKLLDLGVRMFGIACGDITGRPGSYLTQYCSHVVDVHDFEMTESGSNVTQELATHIT